MIGLGYYGTHHPGRHPPQRAGEPGLVHRLHAVPAGDQPGPARGAAQLPDRRRRPHGAHRRPARRCSTRRTAAAEAMTLMRRTSRSGPEAALVVDRDLFPQTLAVVRTRAEPLGLRVVEADLSGAVDAESAAERAGRGGREAAASACWSSTRPARAPSVTWRPVAEAAHARGRPRHGGRRPARPDPAAGAGRDGRRRRRRHDPALRRADGLRRPARRLPRRARRPRAVLARPAGRRERRRRRRTGATGWRCRPASSTSAGRRRPATSAPRRCCSP